jgi:hypothetical protein
MGLTFVWLLFYEHFLIWPVAIVSVLALRFLGGAEWPLALLGGWVFAVALPQIIAELLAHYFDNVEHEAQRREWMARYPSRPVDRRDIRTAVLSLTISGAVVAVLTYLAYTLSRH